MNTKLLRKVRDHLKEEPRRWSFDWIKQSSESPCGTKACIAGWAMILSTGKSQVDEGNWSSHDAARALDISFEEASRLFIYWPEEFAKKSEDPDNAIARINFFLKTKGTDVLPTPKTKTPRKSLKGKEIPPPTT